MEKKLSRLRVRMWRRHRYVEISTLSSCACSSLNLQATDGHDAVINQPPAGGNQQQGDSTATAPATAPATAAPMPHPVLSQGK